MQILYYALIVAVLSFLQCSKNESSTHVETSGNPILPGWYADPEGAVFGSEYWIYPTHSARYDEQVFLDAFSSKDLITWEKHPHILDTSIVKWAHRAMWAPAIIAKNNHYFLFFSANDIQRPGGPLWDANETRNHAGGIGIAVADSPAGPFRDYLGKPLIPDFHNDAQPIDQFVFKDVDESYYMVYGGWRRCNLVKLNEDFTELRPWPDGTIYKEITPEGYVEGPIIFRRTSSYYFMWSEGSWGDGSYQVAYAMANTVEGPYNRIGAILTSDENVATGAGHNSVINVLGTDVWYLIYHRRPIPNEGRDHRVTCIDKLEFNDDSTIKPVKMTFKGVERKLISR